MSKIKILSEHLANQIAAGEVIERPASIAKELLENAIDAGARQISIQIEGGGTRLIRVIDDGEGMDQDDVLLCIERHATSKLNLKTANNSELPTISTLGFRGEAIPSIASVARLTIISRPKSSELGTRAEIRYGKISKVHEAGCSRGTVMEVRDLFANLPARKKFLKSDKTELYHIKEAVKNYCLANPEIGISYMVNNKTVLDLPAQSDSLENRVRRISGRLDLPLIPLAAAGPVSLSGFLLPPDESYGSKARLRIFVNNRAVKDRTMAHAVIEGLAGYLMKGRSPAGALFLDISPEDVDVNVHPTKQEVRFFRPDKIHRLIEQAVRQAMADYQQNLKESIFAMPTDRGQTAAAEQLNSYSGVDRSSDLPGFKSRPARLSSTYPIAGISTAEPKTTFQVSNSGQLPEQSSLTPIGQLMNLYILCQSSDGLVLIDQHAAHERIIFEELKKQHRTERLKSQILMFPAMLELDDAPAMTIKARQEEIKALGIDIEEFGDSSYLIKAVPAILGHLQPEEIITGLLEQFSVPEYDKKNQATRNESILADMACKAAVKAGHDLSPQEIDELLRKMRDSDAFSHCPHGRPVFKSFTADDIKKWFHRT